MLFLSVVWNKSHKWCLSVRTLQHLKVWFHLSTSKCWKQRKCRFSLWPEFFQKESFYAHFRVDDRQNIEKYFRFVNKVGVTYKLREIIPVWLESLPKVRFRCACECINFSFPTSLVGIPKDAIGIENLNNHKSIQR